MVYWLCFFFASRRRHTRCALVTGVQTCALPIWREASCSCRLWCVRSAGQDPLFNPQARCRAVCLQVGRVDHDGLRVGACGSQPLHHTEEDTPFTPPLRSEEHTSELQSLMRISYAVFCLKKKKIKNKQHVYTP